MLKIHKFYLFALISQLSFAQLPPIFGEEYINKTSQSDMVKTYISPQKIIWKSDKSGEFIQNENTILNKGNG